MFAGGYIGYRDAVSKRAYVAEQNKVFLKSLETDKGFVDLEAKLIASGRYKKKPVVEADDPTKDKPESESPHS